MIQLLLTTFLYLLMFFASFFACQYAQLYQKKNKFIFWTMSIIAILVPALFAGFRGEEVGTDVLSYAKPEFILASSSGSLRNYLESTSTDCGYALLVFFSTKLGNNFHILLFFTSILQLTPIYISGVKISSLYKIPLYYVMGCYYFLYYIVGFNIMRQEIAAGFLLLCFVFLLERKKVKALLAYIIAQSFHSSAIIGLSFIFVGLLLYLVKNKFIKLLLVFASICSIFVAMFNWANLAKLLMNSGLLPASRMQVYINVFSGINVGYKTYMFEVALSQYLEILFKILLFIFPLTSLINKKVDRFLYSSIVIVLIGNVINVLFLYIFKSAYGYRIALYAEYFYMFVIPLTISKGKKKTIFDESHRKLGNISLPMLINGGLVLLNWIILFMYFGNHETLPFYFSLYN